MGDRGYFPPGESVLRRVHEERVVGVMYGQRALLLQAMHPLAYTGLIGNTGGLEAPFARLVHTAKAMETVFFGSCAEADRLTAGVRRMHARVRGALAEPAGRWPAGSRYAADDPELLLWVLVWLADSALAVHETFVGRLGRRDLERFWDDYLTVGELFGLQRRHAPRDHAGFRAYLEERLAGEDLFVTGHAHDLALRVAFDLPVPAHRRPALAVINFAIRGLLPPRARHLYRLPWSTADAAALRALAAASRAGAAVVPRALWTGSSQRDYDVVARGERRLLERAAA